MSAVQTIQSLLTLGVQIQAAATKSGQTVLGLLDGPDFAAIEGSVQTLMNSLKPSDLQGAVAAIQQKEADLLAGRDITALSVDELTQFHALVSTEQQLVSKLLTQPQRIDFMNVLVTQVLPVLVQVAKIVIPLLT
jgi:hypothetical protein